MNFKIYTLFFVSAVVLSGCQSYTQENSNIRNNLYNGKIPEATKMLDESSLATEGRNFALFKMEKGMLLYLQSDYQNATKNWIQSDQKLEDLYTTSISKTAASFIINDSITDYTGESHEKILLPIFSSIAFFANEDTNNSIVMIRRTNDIKKAMDSDDFGKNLYKFDIFSNYFSGLVYETKSEWDSAIIEYKKAITNIQLNAENSHFKSAELQISKDLGRLAEFRNRTDILKEIKAKFPNLTWENHHDLLKKAEIFVIYESGNSPIKVPKEILFPTDRTVVRISFPEYKDIQYKSKISEVYVNSKLAGKTILMEDIGKMAKQALEDRRVRDVAKMAARVLAKEVAARKLGDENPLAGLAANAFGAITETADTRSWTTLPDTLQVFRISIPANKLTSVSIKPEYGMPLEQNFTLPANKKKLIRLRTFN